MAWKIAKILCGMIYLYLLYAVSRELYDTLRFPFACCCEIAEHGEDVMRRRHIKWILTVAILGLWFAAGFIFCVLQHKFRNLKWGIIIHSILTLSLFAYVTISIAFF